MSKRKKKIQLCANFVKEQFQRKELINLGYEE